MAQIVSAAHEGGRLRTGERRKLIGREKEAVYCSKKSSA